MILVTGACGQLGYDVVKELNGRKQKVIATDIFPEMTELPQDVRYMPLDITEPKAAFEFFEKTRPDAVIHCAAWTNVWKSVTNDSHSKYLLNKRLRTNSVSCS